MAWFDTPRGQWPNIPDDTLERPWYALTLQEAMRARMDKALRRANNLTCKHAWIERTDAAGQAFWWCPKCGDLDPIVRAKEVKPHLLPCPYKQPDPPGGLQTSELPRMSHSSTEDRCTSQ